MILFFFRIFSFILLEDEQGGNSFLFDDASTAKLQNLENTVLQQQQIQITTIRVLTLSRPNSVAKL